MTNFPTVNLKYENNILIIYLYRVFKNEQIFASEFLQIDQCMTLIPSSAH